MSMADAFGAIARNVSAALGGPYHAGRIHEQGDPVYDDGGSIVTPGTATHTACMAQMDVMTDAMRLQDGFVEGDVRILVLDGAFVITTDSELEITEGPHIGRWMVQSVTRDPFGVYWELRGR